MTAVVIDSSARVLDSAHCQAIHPMPCTRCCHHPARWGWCQRECSQQATRRGPRGQIPSSRLVADSRGCVCLSLCLTAPLEHTLSGRPLGQRAVAAAANPRCDVGLSACRARLPAGRVSHLPLRRRRRRPVRERRLLLRVRILSAATRGTQTRTATCAQRRSSQKCCAASLRALHHCRCRCCVPLPVVASLRRSIEPCASRKRRAGQGSSAEAPAASGANHAD